MNELFIYYRARPERAPAVQAAVAQLHARLRAQHPALVARLLQRPGEDKGLQTWMETYASDAGIGSDLQAQIEEQAHALLPLIEGPRHVEVFIACAS